MNKIECAHFFLSESFGLSIGIYITRVSAIYTPRPLPTIRQIKYIFTRNLVRATRMTDRCIK